MPKELKKIFKKSEGVIEFPSPSGTSPSYDIHYYAGYRVQLNPLNGHCCLHGPDDSRVIYQSKNDAFEALEELKKSGLKQSSDHLVVILPGRRYEEEDFDDIRDALTDENYEHLLWTYPSHTEGPFENAEFLEDLLDSLDEINKVSFVAFSNGGLILRCLLDKSSSWKNNIKIDQPPVVIAAPNNGTDICDWLWETPGLKQLFMARTGPGGYYFTSEGAKKIPDMKEPSLVIAGRSDRMSWTQGLHKLGLLKKTHPVNDGVVPMYSARVANEKDAILIPSEHTDLLSDPRTVREIISCLKNGCFTKSKDTQPLSNDWYQAPEL